MFLSSDIIKENTLAAVSSGLLDFESNLVPCHNFATSSFKRAISNQYSPARRDKTFSFHNLWSIPILTIPCLKKSQSKHFDISSREILVISFIWLCVGPQISSQVIPSS